MRTVIFANGWLKEPPPLRPDDRLVAADGGAKHCLRLGLRPAVVIGDQDSLSADDLAALQAAGAQFIRYPTRKDYTDLELALQYVQEQGTDEVLILGALGSRWDQTVANLLLAAASTTLKICLADGRQEIYYLHSAETLHLMGSPGDTVSLIALSSEARGITTLGLEYPLKDETLTFGSTRGVSNVLLQEAAEVVLREGLLLCTMIHAPIQTLEGDE